MKYLRGIYFMCKKNICCLCSILITVLLMGCVNNTNNSPATGLKYNVEGLPSIDKFSDTEYEEYEWHFPPVESAVLIHNGTEKTIAPDDPRLIRLLNFLAYSDVELLTSWRQGYVEEEEINSYLACDVPMLEVYFNCEKGTKGYTRGNTPQIVICRDSYIMIVNHDNINWAEEGDVYAERLWPYAALVSDVSMLSYEGWGMESWIDMLEYAGFYTE